MKNLYTFCLFSLPFVVSACGGRAESDVAPAGGSARVDEPESAPEESQLPAEPGLVNGSGGSSMTDLPEPPPDGTGGAEPDPLIPPVEEPPEEPPAPQPPVFGGVEEFCEATCETLPSGPGCDVVADCSTNCTSRADSWNDAVRDVFSNQCAGISGGCSFIDVDTCLLWELHPDTETTAEFNLFGMQFPDGTTVRMDHFGEPIAETALVDGAAQFIVPENTSQGSFGPSATFWLDADGSGDCDVAHDRFFTFGATFNGDLTRPSYSGAATLADLDRAWFDHQCAWFFD